MRFVRLIGLAFPLVCGLVLANCAEGSRSCEPTPLEPCNDEPEATVLQPAELCTDYSAAAVATFQDSGLEAAVREALSLGGQEDLTCGRLAGLVGLSADAAGISSLVGLQNAIALRQASFRANVIADIAPIGVLTALRELDLVDNQISDITPLAGLLALTVLEIEFNEIADVSSLSGITGLVALNLNVNSVTDIEPLAGLSELGRLELADNGLSVVDAVRGLTQLDDLLLFNNPGLTDIQPLLDNEGLGAGDLVDLVNTGVSCSDVATLEATGASVLSDCP